MSVLTFLKISLEKQKQSDFIFNFYLVYRKKELILKNINRVVGFK